MRHDRDTLNEMDFINFCLIISSFFSQLYGYHAFGHSCPLDGDINNGCYKGNIALLIVSGLLVNGPYALITTAVSAELGVHPSLQGMCQK